MGGIYGRLSASDNRNLLLLEGVKVPDRAGARVEIDDPTSMMFIYQLIILVQMYSQRESMS